VRIYLAARYPRREELCGYRSELEARGHQVTSRWLDGPAQVLPDGTALGAQRESRFEADDPREAATRALFARRDLADIDAAELLIAFTEDPALPSPPGAARGGRHADLGYATGRGMPVIVCGPRENLFCHLPQVTWFPGWAEFLAAHDDGSLPALLLAANTARLELKPLSSGRIRSMLAGHAELPACEDEQTRGARP
jgi:hypothetical protein